MTKPQFWGGYDTDLYLFQLSGKQGTINELDPNWESKYQEWIKGSNEFYSLTIILKTDVKPL